jgi:hypothetical protein
MPRRISVLSPIILVAILAAGVVFSGCRTAAPPEAGLAAEVFAQETATVTRGPQGGWHVVAATGQTLAGFTTVTFDDNTELFYAVPRGDRTAAILPVTPTSRGWLTSAENNQVEVAFADDPARLEFPDPVGLWDGADDSEITWLGGEPGYATFGAVLPASAPKAASVGLSKHMVGVARLSDGSAKGIDADFGDATSDYLLLPELDSRPVGARVVNTTGVDLGDLNLRGIEVVEESSDVGFSDKPTEYEYLPVGRELGADILVFDAGGASHVAAIGPSKFALRDGALRAVAIARVPIRATSAEAVAAAVRGLAYVKAGAPLAATHAFSPDNHGIYDNLSAAQYRIAELAGAAGLAEWSRIPLFDGAEGVTPDRLLYFANAVSLSANSLDLVVADNLYREAASGFAYWPSDAQKLGQARARTGLALVLLRRDRADEAIDMLEMALDRYKDTKQPLYAADTEMLMAHVHYLGGKTADAVKAAKTARSRYYYANARYHAALAEMQMAAYMLANGEAAEAAKNAGYARQRLDKMGEPVATNRATIVEIMANIELNGFDSGAEERLSQAFERAANLNDAEGATMAASTIALRSTVRDSRRLGRLGAPLVMESNRIIDPLVRERADRAIGVLCAQGLSRALGGSEQVEAICSDAMAGVSGDPATLRSWVEQGYMHLQRGDVDLANATLADLEEQMNDELTSAEPVLAARILIYKWAVGQIDRASKDETIERAMTLLRNGLNPEKAASRLAELATEQRARGLSEVAVWTLSLGAQQAKDAKDYALEREITLELLETHRSLSDWSALRSAAQDAKSVMSRGGDAAKPQLAHAELYHAHAYYMLGKTADGDLTTESAFGNITDASANEKLSLHILGAGFAVERGDLELASKRAAEIQSLLVKGAGSKVDVARANLARGDVFLARGNGTSAMDAYAAALGNVRTASLGSGGVERVDALTGLAGLTDDLTAVEDYESQLTSVLRDAEPEAAPLAAARAYEMAIQYHLGASDAGQAERVMSDLHEFGLSAEARFATDCLDGAVLLANGKSDEGVPRLERCVERRGGSPAGELARVRVALADGEMAAENKASVAQEALEAAKQQLAAYERARLSWLIEYAKPSKTFDADEAERLENEAKESQTPAAIAEYADYLIAYGRTETASSFIDKNSTAFFAEGQESPGELIRLRLETTVRQLQPGAADFYAQRSLSEATGVDDASMARIQLVLAQNSVIAGAWWSARRQIFEARDLAQNAGDKDLQQRIEDFAQTFSILSFSE